MTELEKLAKYLEHLTSVPGTRITSRTTEPTVVRVEMTSPEDAALFKRTLARLIAEARKLDA